MNEMLFRTLLKRYEALIEDSLYKIQSLNENNIIIPEHVDITGEVDKLLEIIAGAEDKLAAMRKYYGEKKAHRASEGKTVMVDYRGPVKDTVQEILGGLRSACTYAGAKTIKDLPKCTTFVRVNRQLNEIFS